MMKKKLFWFKYDAIWNVSTMLNYLKKIISGKLDFIVLTEKMATLIALSTN